ncbi:hypothetical protein DL240_02235 [Lujinxingia litoralis]|uniref:Uncharacterized protein n=1 Tax=Lujinxingia litoralis TaxID=2211119 RepID=A0A328CE08_9DELT|nr:hypothetical protein [Lujinxingia litoralis]RAL25053.1 hypothetical protein DL240_02235 [Lujinxingia litoralis]
MTQKSSDASATTPKVHEGPSEVESSPDYQPPRLENLGQLRALIRGFSGPGNDGAGEGTGFGDP